MNHGVSNARRIPCARKPETHGFHPNDEACPYCCPAAALRDELQPCTPLEVWLAEQGMGFDWGVYVP